MTKERLKQYRDLVLEQKKLKEDIEKLRAKCEGGAIILSDMPKGGVPPDYATELVDAIRKMVQIEAAIHSEIVSIEEFIAIIPESRTRLIFRHRYIDGIKWEEIADNMNYNVSHIRRLHDNYLKKSL